MTTPRLFALSLLFATVTGCGGRDSTSPDPVGREPDKTVMRAASPTTVDGLTEQEAGPLPMVRIFTVPSFIPVAGVLVTFTRDDNTADRYSVRTDAYGYAQLASWVLGKFPGKYTVTATADGLEAVSFSALARGPVIATWDLVSVDGDNAQCFAYPDITGGRYVLLESGLFYRYYFRNGNESLPVSPTGTFVSYASGNFEFYLPPATGGDFYRSRNGLFATGVVTGDHMHVTYEDFVDFCNEVYERR